MNLTKRIVSIGLVALTVAHVSAQGPAAPAKTGPSTDDLFNNGVVQDVQLFMSARDLAEMRERYWENLYFPADFLWNGIRVRNVGIRIRGLASRSASKPGLRIDFNRYTEKQTFLGLHSVILDNALKDPSFIRERTSMAFIEYLGAPASREAFVRVFINGEYHGVYAIVEAVDKEYLARTLGENNGYLFDHHYLNGFHAEDLGDDLSEYKVRFEAQTRKLESDSVLYPPLRELFKEINHEVDGAWRSRVSEYIDLDQLMTYLAVENFLAEDDGFLGGAGMANFYLYRRFDSNQHRLLPWDRDTTFTSVEMPIFLRAKDNELVKRALMFDDLRERYLATLERCARKASTNNWLDGEIRRMDGVIKDAVYSDPKKMFSNEEYDHAIEVLLDFAKWRSSVVRDQVAQARKCGSGCF